MRTALRFLILLMACSGLGLGSVRAGDRLWVGLYLAENGPPPPNAILAPQPMHERLHEVFGFKHYELLKAEELELRNGGEHWFQPRKDFFLRVVPLRRLPGGPRLLGYEIYNDGFMVARGRYELREDTPLFINGPDLNQGRLIFVLDPH